MRQFLITMAGVFAGLALFLIGVPVVAIGWLTAASKPAPPAARTVLQLDLREGLPDQASDSPLAALAGHGGSVIGLVETLRAAEKDDRVKAMFVRLPEGGLPPAAADELRDAFRRFRAAGKPILAFGQGLYADTTALSTYEVAAASGEVWLQTASSFQAVGLARQDVFFKRAFDRFKVRPDYQQRYEYKNAVNPFLYEDYTPAHRESELSWMGSVYGSVLKSVAADRKLPLERLKAVIEGGPYDAQTARDKGLIDKVGDESAAEKAILGRAGDGAEFKPVEDYAESLANSSHLGAPPAQVALIAVEGDIMTGKGGGGGFGGSKQILSDDVAQAFKDAIEDKAVKAIVFRVSSPGGSDTASEQILAAVRAAKAAGKPVVVSMGTYAASGGYWISSEASEIVAQPTTLTGSIGVFGGKFALGEALGAYGVDMRGLKVGGDFADAFASGQPMSATQHAAMSAWMDGIYNGFVARVSQGRRLPLERVRQIARGRVWTGVQARDLGLVDRLGGLFEAVQEAKRLAGIKGETRLKPFTAQGSPFESLKRLLGGASDGARILVGLGQAAHSAQGRALIEAVQDQELRQRGAAVLAPTPFR